MPPLDQVVETASDRIFQNHHLLWTEILSHIPGTSCAQSPLQQSSVQDIPAEGILHDLSNLLVPVQSMVEQLKESVSEDSPYREQIEDLYRRTDIAISFVKNARRIRAGDPIELSPVSIGDVLSDTVKAAKSYGKGAYIVNTGENFQVNSEYSLLCSVFVNLLKNSIEAMDNHGTIGIESYVERERGWIRISDAGRGMNPEKVRALFYSGESLTGEKTRGYGMRMVSALVEKLDGTIHVESQVGIGTTYTLSFPLAHYGTKRQNSPVQELDLTNLQVVYVDDDSSTRNSFRDSFNHLKIHSVGCQDAEEALEYLAGHKADILITDGNMPCMIGAELAKIVKENYPDMIRISHSGIQEFMSDSEKSFFDVFLDKPAKASDIKKAIMRVYQKTETQ